MNLNEIETSPPRKFRAVHKETKRIYKFTLDYILDHGDIAFLKECHIDLFTGHHDASGKEVYGGDVEIFKDTIAIVVWNTKDAAWRLRWWDREEHAWAPYLCSLANNQGWSAVIGNIHNPAELPEEVRRMLDEH